VENTYLDHGGRPLLVLITEEETMPVNIELLNPQVVAKVNDAIRRWWQVDILVVTDTIVSFGSTSPTSAWAIS
jgi:hypothetical protein